MTKLHVDDRGIGVCFSGGVREFLSFPKCFKQAVGPSQPPIRWVPTAFSLEIQQPGHEADH
jgi:hypothetical protein